MPFRTLDTTILSKSCKYCTVWKRSTISPRKHMVNSLCFSASAPSELSQGDFGIRYPRDRRMFITTEHCELRQLLHLEDFMGSKFSVKLSQSRP